MDKQPNPLFLDVETVKLIHADQIYRYGGSPELLQRETLESAVQAPQNLWFYSEESDIFHLAACYCSHLALNHPFENGNKRTALDEEAHAFVVDWVISTLGAVSIDLCQRFWINPKRLEPVLATCQKALIEKVSAKYQAQFGLTIDRD